MDKVSKDRDLEKIKMLLLSGEREEMELALILAEANELDLTSIEEGIKSILSVSKLHPKLGQWADAKMENLLYPLGMVLTLTIEENILIKELPEEIGFFRNLGILELQEIELEKIPATIRHISNLRSLNLKHNRLRSIPPEIGNLTKLKSLNLHNNFLEFLPDSLQHLSALEVLELSKNPNLKILPYWLGRLPSLKRLVLDKAVFGGVVPETLLPIPDSVSVEWESIQSKF
jgi:Leucine-rich repeat (LRR) protein